jgi:capsular polysaccharide transport system permease protein
MFFALGTLAYQFYRRVASFCSAAFDANQALLSYPIVKQVDTLVARAALEVATCLFVSLIMLGGLLLIASQPPPAHIEAIIIAVVLLVLLGFGHGTLNAVVGTYFPSWRNIEPLLSRPLFILSGVFFVPDRMPPKIVPFLSWNPILHGVELVRYGYYPDYRSPTLDVMYLLFWALGLTVLGLAAERAMRVRAGMNEGGQR